MLLNNLLYILLGNQYDLFKDTISVTSRGFEIKLFSKIETVNSFPEIYFSIIISSL